MTCCEWNSPRPSISAVWAALEQLAEGPCAPGDLCDKQGARWLHQHGFVRRIDGMACLGRELEWVDVIAAYRRCTC